MAELPMKRRRLSDSDEPQTPGLGPLSLTRTISPPRKRVEAPPLASPKLVPSPFRLTTIRDLPARSNVGAVSLGDLLGDPLIAACWNFNFLHDIPFLVNHFDEDTRHLVQIHLVHGFWKNEDPNRLLLNQEASQYNNVTLHAAYMPEMFGTHHSKMLVLLRQDDTAQIIIHTANMIAKDWTNMTNAVWQSPLLPLLRGTSAALETRESSDAPLGSGTRFKADILSYLRAYNSKRDVCRSLVDELKKYDFSAIRGALIASVPGRHAVRNDPSGSRWGWAAMKQNLQSVPVQRGKSELVVQVSSIATLGGTDTWLQRTLFDVLSSASSSTRDSILQGSRPGFRVIFPTPDEIRRSLDGYASGGSIHTKIQSAQQVKQLQYLRPIFCHWANDSPHGVPLTGTPSAILGPNDSGRQRAAPHIKTYIRYHESGTLDWALLTSANISKQAWGEAATGAGDFRIASWEVGVLVWPELFTDGKESAKMIATFETNVPSPQVLGVSGSDDVPGETRNEPAPKTVVGLRIPYSLPLQRYGPDEKPWVATAAYSEPDWKGRTWNDE